MRLNDPATSFVLVLLIGIVVGLLVERFVRTSWLTRQVAGRNRIFITSALIGIAGAFIGFQIATLAKFGGGAYVPLIAAAIGAAVVVWAWKSIK